jgi:hypothetical protein
MACKEQAAAIRFGSSFANKACSAASVRFGSNFAKKPRLEQAATASVCFANNLRLEQAATAVVHSKVHLWSSFTNKVRLEQAEVQQGTRGAGSPAWLSDVVGEAIDGLTRSTTVTTETDVNKFFYRF